jgi:hypothetical protein
VSNLLGEETDGDFWMSVSIVLMTMLKNTFENAVITHLTKTSTVLTFRKRARDKQGD